MISALQRCVFAAVMVAALASCKPRQQETPDLRTPDAAALAQPAPDSFKVSFSTGKGRFVVQAHRSWAPHGVDRFYYLVSNNYYDGTKFFRNIDGFMAQFGIHGDPLVNEAWRDRNIPDDTVKQSNKIGYVTYAMGGPSSRTVQLFINKADNSRLDAMGFAPIGRVVEGMDVVNALYTGYGDGPPRGAGPEQGRIAREGNRYLSTDFPRLDSIVTARIVKD